MHVPEELDCPEVPLLELFNKGVVVRGLEDSVVPVVQFQLQLRLVTLRGGNVC